MFANTTRLSISFAAEVAGRSLSHMRSACTQVGAAFPTDFDDHVNSILKYDQRGEIAVDEAVILLASPLHPY